MALLCSDVRFRMWFCHAYALTFPSAAMCNMQCAVLCCALLCAFNTHKHTHTHMHHPFFFALLPFLPCLFWIFEHFIHFLRCSSTLFSYTSRWYIHIYMFYFIYFFRISLLKKLNFHNSCKAKQVKRLLNHKQWTNKHNELDNIILGSNPCVVWCKNAIFLFDGAWFIATPTGIWTFAAVHPAITNNNEYQPAPHLAYGQGMFFFSNFQWLIFENFLRFIWNKSEEFSAFEVWNVQPLENIPSDCFWKWFDSVYWLEN